MSTRALLLLLGMMVGCESEVAKNGDTDVPPPKGKEDIDCGDTDRKSMSCDHQQRVVRIRRRESDYRVAVHFD